MAADGTPTRVAWLDYAKAVGLFLVVYGHSAATGAALGKWIYSFHMPLFFLLSGYLLKERVLRTSWREFVAGSVRSLGPAYLAFSALGYIAWVLVLRKTGSDANTATPVLYPLLAIFYGTGTPEGFRLEPLILWFFPCLLSARLLVYAVCRYGRGYALVLSVLLAALGLCVPKDTALPWEIETALVAQCFMVLGLEAKRRDIFARAWRGRAAAALALFLLGAACAYWNAPVDMRTSRYGNPALFMTGALVTSGALCLMLLSYPERRLASEVAKNAIVIFPLHKLVFSAFSAVYVFGLGLPLETRTHPVLGLVASAINIALLTFVVAPLIQRFVPWIYGLKS